ncbi:MAG: response regulator transcription factor, partial [Clostridiales bacterium]|jgi:DNA-binding response OmpR family regulator|nr:response regulator transcription factor [Clostridiales bacterium]
MHEGYEVISSADGREGLELAVADAFELVILDIMLPGLNGMEVLRRLRQSKSTPVLILTARDQVTDKVMGLDFGADDYMTKPFAIEELLARIRTILKRHEISAAEVPDAAVRRVGKLVIGLNKHSVTYDGHNIELTRKEYDLLLYLIENKNKVLTRDKILDVVWGYDFYGDTNVVDVYIRYLRSKIDDKFSIKLIQTLRGTGYIIKED